MGQEMKRIRINKLSSEHNIFDEICFRDGVNLILGEKYDESITKGRKTNGVGKSMSVEFIDFCLLNDYKKSRIAKIPKEVLDPDENILLDISIGEDKVLIKRNTKNYDKPIIMRNGKATQFEKIDDAKDYLIELIFSNLSAEEIPSLRKILSIIIRDEKSEFSDILKCHDVKSRIPDDLAIHLYMLGFSLEKYSEVLGTINEIEKTQAVLSKVKAELTENGSKKMPDVMAEMNALEAEVQQLELAIDSYKSNEAFDSIEEELAELENMLDQLRRKQKVLKRELSRIKEMPQPEQVDDDEIGLVYNQFKANLGDAIVKSLNEVIGFKNKVEEFQRVLVNQKARDLETQIAEISSQIRFLDDKYSEKMKIIDTKGVLRNLKSSLKIYETKRDASAHTKFLFEQYEQYDKQKKRLQLKKSQELLEIDADIEALSKELKSFMNTILDIHESIMGNRECSFDIKTKNTLKGKTPIEMSMRIFDDGSHSVDRTKVFIYDMALMFNEYTRVHHPLFLIHDNIFDVDQDTLVQCLNYVAKQEELFSDFQYILTLNRDKIENEERQKLIKMDVEEHCIATFTKANKFLKCDYQEK
ncbi:DUF2326 domain-containing protein [Butyrivibrio sp. INlla16]|uniref:DUF2326 domain-containing protein n=1 Tax=Butyrivibrio sp. INlla16 TaxID=1520807 RepID=UPI00088D417C|nr:DUF2326 domain-containing protein [Butyrivibrio sp. INlla16]SDB66067.1 Uncharacterized protein YydD, contains DUF2326 domain [Butyrivibrio sp. INlla16]